MFKYIHILTKLATLLPFLLVAILAGLISGSMVKCSSDKAEPIPVKIELYNYEKSLSEIRKNRDSVVSNLPTKSDAWDYIFDRYDTKGRIPKPY